MLNLKPSDHLHVEQANDNKMQLILDIWNGDDENKNPWGISAVAARFPYQVPSHSYYQGLHLVPYTATTWQHIKKWPAEQVSWQSEDIRLGLIEKANIWKRLTKKAQMQVDWREGFSPHVDIEDAKLPLLPHQRIAAYLGYDVAEDDGYAFFMEQGTGKTPVAINVADYFSKRQDRLTMVLVAVPPVLKRNWANEIPRFSTLDSHVWILNGNKVDRMVNLYEQIAIASANKKDTFFCIVPYDTLVTTRELFARLPWDLGFADESQWFKDPTTKRWGCLEVLRDSIKRRYILTGTPVGNSEADAWTQLEFMAEGASDTASFDHFRKEFCNTQQLDNGLTVVTGSRQNGRFQEIVAARSFVCKKEEVFKDLPEKVYELNEVEMIHEQARHYKQMATFMVMKINEEMQNLNGNSASANNILTQIIRLNQITSGYHTIDPEYNEWGEVVEEQQIILYPKNPKIDRLLECAEELPQKEKMIIWNKWVPLIGPIYKALNEKYPGQVVLYRNDYDEDWGYTGPRGYDCVDAFNEDRNVRFFIANQRSANMGLNLLGYPPGREDEYDTNCTEMVYFSYDFSYLDRAQSEDRAHRHGTRTQLRIRDLFCPGTIDEEILNALRMKKELADNFTNVQEILARLAGVEGLGV